jgi:hypothetical protein
MEYLLVRIVSKKRYSVYEMSPEKENKTYQKIHFRWFTSKPGRWFMVIISAIQERRLGGLQLEDSLGKKLGRPPSCGPAMQKV